MGKGSIKYYKKKADKLFSEIIRSRKWCEAPHAGGKKCSSLLDCAHVIPRTNLTLRWDLKNGLCLCRAHHLYWQHKDPIAFTNWFAKKYPDRRRYLLKKRYTLTKRTLEDYKNLVKVLQKQLKGCD